MDKIHGESNDLDWIEVKKFRELVETQGRKAQLCIASWVYNKVEEDSQREVLLELLDILGLKDVPEEPWYYAPQGKLKHRLNEATKTLKPQQTLCRQIIRSTWNGGEGASRRPCLECVTEHARLKREPGTTRPLVKFVSPKEEAWNSSR